MLVKPLLAVVALSLVAVPGPASAPAYADDPEFTATVTR